jgi:hypothetical protein
MDGRHIEITTDQGHTQFKIGGDIIPGCTSLTVQIIPNDLPKLTAKLNALSMDIKGDMNLQIEIGEKIYKLVEVEDCPPPL